MQSILAILLIAAVFAVGISLYINSKLNKGLGNAITKSLKADIKIEKARYVETRDGRKEWELEADSAQYFKDDAVTVFENVKVVFYSTSGISYVLKGDRGRLKNDSKNMEISGHVEVASADGYKLVTDSLIYKDDVKQISTKDKVSFTGHGIDIQGTGLLADMVKETVFVLANVKTVVNDAAM